MIFFDALLKVFKCNVGLFYGLVSFRKFKFLTISFVVNVSSIILFNCCSTDNDVVADVVCVLSKSLVVEVVSFSRTFLGGISCEVC